MTDVANPPATSTSETVASIEDVSVNLGGRRVLDAVSFELHRGEFTGLIGANGAGKTTLLRVILGLVRPTSGRVRLGSVETAGHGRGVGYVPQKVLLDPDIPLRARDLVALGLDGHRLGLRRRTRSDRDRVEEMIEAVDARSFAGARVGNLSGGEQQRVLIAHALVSRPRLLLLDEPLANLDIRSTQEIIELLARVSSQHQVAILLSAHEMNPLLPVMDRVVYIAGGKAASGTTEEVIKADVLSRLYGHHVDVLRIHGRILVVSGTEGVDDMGHSLEIG
jgi:zinc/manganese transport system ATP-binding protein